MFIQRLSHACRSLIAMALLIVAGGCATYRPPETSTTPVYLDRVQTRVDGAVSVSSVVLSSEESRNAFAADLAAKGVQPIWFEIHNDEDQAFTLLINSVDSDYFSPSEAAWVSRGFGERATDRKVRYFFEQHVPTDIPANTTVSGFVYTNLSPGGKAFGLTLVGQNTLREFEFVQEIPGLRLDWTRVDFPNLYPAGTKRELNLEELRTYLESLACCVLGGDQETEGDPLNIVVIGEGVHMLATFIRLGWDMTETTHTGSALRTAASSLFGARYRTSPVSSLYLFGRGQDVALQKARGSVDERNHLRLWLAPVTFEGKGVWVGQISRDIGVKLSSRTLVTHRIDPLVDEARYYLAADMASSQSVDRLGFVSGVGVSTDLEPRFNFTHDPYYTDGLRVVLFLTSENVGLDEIERLNWEMSLPPTSYIRRKSSD